LQQIAKRLESAMQSDRIPDVRKACAEFLATASEFYSVPNCGIRVLAARPLRTREHGTFELFGDYATDSMLDPRVDANGGAEGSHFVRYIREHPLPRVLSPSRFPKVRIPRFLAHTRIL
jgi:hypothetical protein